MDNTEQTIPQDIYTFLSNMITEAGLTLDDKTREGVIKELFLQLDNYMLTVIVEELPEDKLEVFTKMNEDGRPKEELEKYLQENIPNANEIFARAMFDFRNLYLGNVAAVRNRPSDNTTDNTENTNQQSSSTDETVN